MKLAVFPEPWAILIGCPKGVLSVVIPFFEGIYVPVAYIQSTTNNQMVYDSHTHT